LAARNPNTVTVCLAHLYLGVIYYEWNELEKAAFQQQLAIDTYRSSRIFGSMDLDTAYLHLARTRAAMTDFKEAFRALNCADKILSGEQAKSESKVRNAAFHAEIALAQGIRNPPQNGLANLPSSKAGCHSISQPLPDAFLLRKEVSRTLKSNYGLRMSSLHSKDSTRL